MAKAFILYGFITSEWHSKKMRRALKRRGYGMARAIEDADLVLAHSGGCYDIPVLRDDQLLVLINPTYWPNRSLAQRGSVMTRQLFKMIRPGNHPLYQLHKLIRYGLNVVLKQRHNRRIARRAFSFNLEREVKHLRTIIIRNDNDPWLTPELGRLADLNPHLKIARLPGEHDDCWLHPHDYLDIIESYR